MKFFHVYNEWSYKGLEKNGLINKDTGFKIQHNFSMPEELKFNHFAAKDSKLYHIIKEGKHPFYVDRIAGGTTYHRYSFDFKLIDIYKELLGDWFLGFQLHESGSNRLNEWLTIISRMGSKGPYDLLEFRKKMIRKNAEMPDGTVLYALSHDTPEYFAGRTYPETPREYLEEMKELFERRLADTNHTILPCDSYYLATKLQDDLGMRTFMPEVGCQIPLMRQAVALARGIAKSSGKTWGAYYECWREVEGIGYCMPCFNNDPSNEWYLTQDQHGDDFTSYGENGGSSRLLQNRIYYYALMSGADYFSEEWGLNCSYSDMNDFTLSAYGNVKKDFIHMAEDFQGVKPITPFAIVLPCTYSCVILPFFGQEHKLGVHRDTYLGRPISMEEKAYYGHIEDVLKLFFARDGQEIGNEGHVITNSRFGDVVDIIYEDAADEVLRRYDYLIDATEDGDFVKTKSGSGLKIIESKDIEKLAVEMKRLIQDTMPCYVDGLCWLVSMDDKGRRMLSIFNNEGNERSLEKGDIIHSEADTRVKLTARESVDMKVLKEAPQKARIEKVDDRTYYITVPAAGFVILEL